MAGRCPRRSHRSLSDTAVLFFFSSSGRHTSSYGDWSSDVCSSDLEDEPLQVADRRLSQPVLRQTDAELVFESTRKLHQVKAGEAEPFDEARVFHETLRSDSRQSRDESAHAPRP